MPQNLISQDKLGLWKLESKINEAYFLAPKSYAYIDSDNHVEIKTKGINIKRGRKENGEHTNYNDIVNLAVKLQPIKIKNMMFKRTLENVKIVDEQERTLDCVYNKRKWFNNNSTPFRNMKSYARTNK